MRVVMVVPRFPKVSETFIVNKFVGLARTGFDVHVVARRDAEAVARFASDLKRVTDWQSRVHEKWPSRPRWIAAALLPIAMLHCALTAPASTLRYLRRGWARFGADVLRRFYLDASIVRSRPDILHFEFGALAPGRMYLGEMLDCRVVVSFRGYDLNFSGLNEPGYYEGVWQAADGIHCLGEDLWRRAVRRGCPPGKTHALIPPAIDVDRFSPSPRGVEKIGGPDRPARIVSVGRVEWNKGYEYALEAVRRLKDRGVEVEYHILGAGAYMEPIGYCRYELGLENEVSLLGAVQPDEVKAELQWADLFLHAAVTEGFCNAVIEAQAMELPVVSSDAGGLPENVADGQTGYIVPRRDPAALADRLEALVRDPDLRRRMGTAGRARVVQHFRLPDQIGAFAAFYREIASQGEIGRASVTPAQVGTIG